MEAAADPYAPLDDRRRYDAFVAEIWRDFDHRAVRPIGDYANRARLDVARLRDEYAVVAEAEKRRETDAPPSPEEPALPVLRLDAPPGAPDRVGEYLVLRVLGRGGFGDVYLGRHRRTGRRAALKVLRRGARLSDYALQKFLLETRVTSQLDHPVICKVFETGFEPDGSPWFAMEHVQGETLAAWISAQRRVAETVVDGSTHVSISDEDATAEIPPPSPKDGAAGAASSSTPTRAEIAEIIGWFEDLARGLHAAHEARIVHRDVKPGNIMIRARDRRPVLLDFGLALDAGSDSERLSRSRQAVGTACYMAPEQTLGLGDVDRRADVWGLGVSLYEALTLVRPFAAARGVELGEQIRRVTQRDPRKLNRAIGDDLAVVVETALQKDPARRYATAEAFADDLRAVRERRPIRARPPGPFVRLVLWAERNRAVAALVAAVVVALAAGLATSLAFYFASRTSAAVAARESARRLAAVLAQAATARLERDPALAAALAAASARAAEEAGERPDIEAEGALLAAAARLDVERTLRRADDAVPAPDGASVALLGRDDRVRVVDVATGAVTTEIPAEGILAAVGFSPDGRRLAVADRGGNVRVVALPGGAVVGRVAVKEPVVKVEPSDDGARVVVAAGSSVRLADVAAGSIVRLTAGDGVLPDVMPHARLRGDVVATAAFDGPAAFFDARSGALRAVVPTRRATRPDVLALAPDGLTLATGGARPFAARLRGDGGVAVADLPEGAEVTALAIGKDGVLVIGRKDGAAEIGALALAGDALVWSGRVRAEGTGAAIVAVAARAEGGALAGSADGAVRVVDADGAWSVVEGTGGGPVVAASTAGDLAVIVARRASDGARVEVRRLAPIPPDDARFVDVFPAYDAASGRLVATDAAGTPSFVRAGPDDAARVAAAPIPLPSRGVVRRLDTARALRRAAWFPGGAGVVTVAATSRPTLRGYVTGPVGAGSAPRPMGAGVEFPRPPDAFVPLADGRRVAVLLHDDDAANDAASGVYDLVTSRRVARLPTPPSASVVLTASPRGDRLLVAGAGLPTEIFAADGDGPGLRLDDAPAATAAFDATGARVLVGFSDGRVVAANAATGAILASTRRRGVVRSTTWLGGARCAVLTDEHLRVLTAALEDVAVVDVAHRGALAVLAAPTPDALRLLVPYGLVRLPADPAAARAAAILDAAAPEDVRSFGLEPPERALDRIAAATARFGPAERP